MISSTRWGQNKPSPRGQRGLTYLDTDLTGEAAVELAEFLGTGSMPEGWVCEAVR